MDLRVKKTQRSLADALDTLLNEEKYEEITVSEICARAEVRRATFYDHFSDKYDLLSFLIQKKIKEYAEIISTRVKSEETVDRREFYVTVIVQTMKIVEENLNQIRHAMGSESFSLLTDVWKDEVVEDIQKRLVEDWKEGMELSLPVNLLAQIYFGVISGMVFWRIGQARDVDKESIRNYAENLVQNSAFLFMV